MADKTALRGIKSYSLDDFQLRFDFGQKLKKL
jgi:hypothetical protein